MNWQLHELKRQRDLVREHLKWLEAQIRDLEGRSTDATPEAPVETQPTPALVPAESTETADTAIPPHPETGESLLPWADKEAIKRQQTIGCVVFFVLATLLALGMILGLPYLIY